ASVRSPFTAASATFALKAGVWFRRARLVIVSPDSRDNLARRQAETPLIALCRFPEPALKFDYKLDWFKRLRSHAGKLLKQDIPVVLAGDYNVAPTAADIYPTKSWDKDALIQPKSRAAFKALVDQGWTDAIRTLHPSKPMFTFWDYKRNRWPRDAGLRLDHLLLSPVIVPRLLKAGVDRKIRGEEGASDHA